MKDATIEYLYAAKFLSELDYQFARFIGRLKGTDNADVLLAASLVSRCRRDGHICLDISEFAEKTIEPEAQEVVACPPLETWLNALKTSPVVGKPGDFRPLILDGSRFYLYRYWDYERRLADGLTGLAETKFEPHDEAHLRESIPRIFPADDAAGINFAVDRRRIAAFASLGSGLCMISGGPGSGKTYAVAKILALLIEQNRGDSLNIALSAPTGKAAARLQESIKKATSELNCQDAVKNFIPRSASTIHRLLKAIPYSPYFRFNRENPLPHDVVVLDEASMVDMPLFSKLVQALKRPSRLILLGDKDQLASVEAGAVFGDICNRGNIPAFSSSFIESYSSVTGEAVASEGSVFPAETMRDCIIHLDRNYRFGPDSGIYRVSQAITAGNGRQAIDMIRHGNYGDIRFRNLPAAQSLPTILREWVIERYASYLKSSDPMEAFDLFNRSRILCTLHDGPYGTKDLNAAVEHILQRHGLIDAGGRWYAGRPVMITRNDYNLQLFNGDIGITLPDCERRGELKVFFPQAETPGRNFSPLRLPEHETVFSMTVHKSQGSEFDDVLFIMPDTDSPVLTRELVYTAVTRSRQNLWLWGKEDIFMKAIRKRIERSSGLRDALWGKTTPSIT